MPDICAIVQGLAVWLQSQNKQHVEVRCLAYTLGQFSSTGFDPDGCSSMAKLFFTSADCVKLGTTHAMTVQSNEQYSMTRKL